MKRTSDERRISMRQEKHIRAEYAKKYESFKRDNTRLGRHLMKVNHRYEYLTEDGHAAVKSRRIYGRLKSKRERCKSLFETNNQLLDKIFVEKQEEFQKFEDECDFDRNDDWRDYATEESRKQMKEAETIYDSFFDPGFFCDDYEDISKHKEEILFGLP